jgi:hypothetical protein
MSNKQLQLVTFEQAKKLAEIFTYIDNTHSHLCDKAYNDKGELYDIFTNMQPLKPRCYVPTTALALKWLRDEKKIFISTRPSFPKLEFQIDCLYQEAKLEFSICEIEQKRFYIYEEAESAGLDYALDYLLKQKS